MCEIKKLRLLIQEQRHAISVAKDELDTLIENMHFYSSHEEDKSYNCLDEIADRLQANIDKMIDQLENYTERLDFLLKK